MPVYAGVGECAVRAEKPQFALCVGIASSLLVFLDIDIVIDQHAETGLWRVKRPLFPQVQCLFRETVYGNIDS